MKKFMILYLAGTPPQTQPSTCHGKTSPGRALSAQIYIWQSLVLLVLHTQALSALPKAVSLPKALSLPSVRDLG